MTDRRDTDFDELPNVPCRAVPDVDELVGIDDARRFETLIPPPGAAAMGTQHAHPARVDDGAERFASIVGVMLDDKLDAQENRFAVALNEVTANQRLTYEAVTHLRDEVRPRLASHDCELVELRTELVSLKGRMTAIEWRLSAMGDDGR